MFQTCFERVTATYGESRADLRGCGQGSRQKASDGNRVESEQEWQQARIFGELKKLVCWSNTWRLWVQAYSKGADSRTLFLESEQDWEEQASGVESRRIEKLDLLETHSSGAEGESLSSCRQDARAAPKRPQSLENSRRENRAGEPMKTLWSSAKTFICRKKQLKVPQKYKKLCQPCGGKCS